MITLLDTSGSDGYTEDEKRDPMKKTTESDVLFEQIYVSTYPALSRYVFFKVADTDDMEDILQNVYVDYYFDVIKKGKQIENPEAYLIKMANHKCGAHFRKEQRIITLDEEDDWTQLIPSDDDTSNEAIQHATSQEIWTLVATFPELDRKILVARFRFELSFPEIAAELEMEETKIKARFYRSLDKIRKKLIIED